MKNDKTAVIVLAAGSGIRLRSKHSKPFVLLSGCPLVVRTLRSVHAAFSSVDLFVAAHPREIKKMRGVLDSHGFRHARVIGGGYCRAQSLSNVLAVLDPGMYSYIAVHDGARPFVPRQLIRRLRAGIAGYDCCIPVLPVRYTIKTVSKSGRVKTLDRRGLWEVQTPQLFRSGALLKAYRQCRKRKTVLEKIYDDSQMIEYAAGSIGMVSGDPGNIKITYPADLAVAQSLIGPLPSEPLNRARK